MMTSRAFLIAVSLILPLNPSRAVSESPQFSDYCERLTQEIQGKKHGFLAGNVTYYVGGFHASWELKEHETLGLTHPFHHDLRSRGVGLVQSRGKGHEDTGLGNDFSGWEFYKDTRVLYGSVVIDQQTHPHPVPIRMQWRPDRVICEYNVSGVILREEKFISVNDAACTIITASRPVTLQFSGQSFFGRHSVTSTATIEFDDRHNAVHITEGGTTRCRPEADRSEHVGPIMYQDMHTVLSSSENLATSHRFSTGEQGQMQYGFQVPCDTNGVALVWAMHDDYDKALNSAKQVLRDPHAALAGKTDEMNRQLNEEIPWFRCSDKKFEDIYYYLWSLYLMYYIDVQSGWEMEPHTQTAVNNFLGIHRYDATFQIRAGAWTGNKPFYAYGNVLTWKHLFRNGGFRQSPDGVISLPDNKGTTWHSGVYGNELSEHVIGAWQIYQHTGDVQFLHDCYEGYFREVFHQRIAPFFSNHFEVAEILATMAHLTGHPQDAEHWNDLVPRSPDQIRHWFDQRWQMHGHHHFFAGPANGMLMTTGFWHLRSKYFPNDYASKMVTTWALDSNSGFSGDFFPLAMSRQSMKAFASQDDNAFGYTPDTAYFTLDGLFRQRLGDSAWRLTLNHLENYNFSRDWKIPVAPEAYTRNARRFGDQYSNFNAGKLLLYLEGLAGLEYSIPNHSLLIHDTMPADWTWMEFRLPVRMPEDDTTHWPGIRYDRSESESETIKSIRVTDCPLSITIEPWTEGREIIDFNTSQSGMTLPDKNSKAVRHRDYVPFRFDDAQTTASVRLRLASELRTD